jgi:hypothetical protein
VDRDFIVQGHDSKIPFAEFRDHGPESISIVFLPLDPNGSLNDPNAPLAAKIRPLPKYFSLEILGEAILGHSNNLACPVAMPGAG